MARFLAASVINDLRQFHLLHLGVLLLKMAAENQFDSISNLIAIYHDVASMSFHYFITAYFVKVRKSPELVKSGAVDSLTSFKTKTPLREAASRIRDQQKYKYKYTSRYLNWYLFIDTCPEVIVRVRVTRTAGQIQMEPFNQNYADEVIVVFA